MPIFKMPYQDFLNPRARGPFSNAHQTHAIHCIARGYDESPCDLRQGPRIAIIGTRHPSRESLEFVRDFCAELAAQKFAGVVVSGGALGVDGAAHYFALQNKIPTQAWLVGPIERPSPLRHEQLFRQIVLAGWPSALMCPQGVAGGPDQAGPDPRWMWVKRNQYLMASSDAVIVAGSRNRSGTWVSVKFALEFGIPVFALPGHISDPSFAGTNLMIATGSAHPITTIKSLMESLVAELGASFYNKDIGARAAAGEVI
jgi:DNA processing protein